MNISHKPISQMEASPSKPNLASIKKNRSIFDAMFQFLCFTFNFIHLAKY